MLQYIERLIVKLLILDFHIESKFLNYILPILFISIGILIYFLLKFIFSKIISFYLSKKVKIDKLSLKKLFLPFQKVFFILFIILLIYFLINPLLKQSEFKKYFSITFSILVIFVSARLFISLIDLILKARFFENIEKLETKKWVKTIYFFLKLFVWSIVLILVLNILGIKVSNILTGLGISGVIIALATQSIFTDLFSYVSIIVDKPFEVGDFVSIDNLSGTVEFIGIKSTRIRILDGELLIIPNTVLTGSKLRNFKNLERRRAYIQLNVPISTSINKLKKLKEKIIEIILNHKEAELERCFISTIVDATIQFDIYYYINIKDFIDFLRKKHEINLEIIKLLKDLNIKLVSNIKSIEVLTNLMDEDISFEKTEIKKRNNKRKEAKNKLKI